MIEDWKYVWMNKKDILLLFTEHKNLTQYSLKLNGVNYIFKIGTINLFHEK